MNISNNRGGVADFGELTADSDCDLPILSIFHSI